MNSSQKGATMPKDQLFNPADQVGRTPEAIAAEHLTVFLEIKDAKQRLKDTVAAHKGRIAELEEKLATLEEQHAMASGK